MGQSDAPIEGLNTAFGYEPLPGSGRRASDPSPRMVPDVGGQDVARPVPAVADCVRCGHRHRAWANTAHGFGHWIYLQCTYSDGRDLCPCEATQHEYECAIGDHHHHVAIAGTNVNDGAYITSSHDDHACVLCTPGSSNFNHYSVGIERDVSGSGQRVAAGRHVRRGW